MKVRVLGAYGGELGPCRNSAYLLENRILLDAGGATPVLTLAEVEAVEACVITHPHMDHVASIPFLLDARIGAGTLVVYGTRETVSALRLHLFNDKIWPDFQKIPDVRHPLLRYHEIERERPFEIAGLGFRAIAVDHTVPTVGYFVRDPKGATVVFSADTGPTERIWKEVTAAENVRAVFLEVSFPNRLERIAQQSKHLTPAMLREELRKIPRAIPVLLNHLKPAFLDELKREIEPILKDRANVRMAEQGHTYDF